MDGPRKFTIFKYNLQSPDRQVILGRLGPQSHNQNGAPVSNRL